MKRPLSTSRLRLHSIIRLFGYSIILFLPALPCAAMPLGLRLAARAAAANAQANAETEEERAYRVYAPDTALLLDLSLIATNTITFFPAIYGSSGLYGGGGSAVRIDWGDGTVSEGTATGWGDTAFPHTYADQGRYVVRIAPTVNMPWTSTRTPDWLHALVRVLRWGDNVTGSDGGQGTNISGAKNLETPLPRWGKSFWCAHSMYSGCTGLTGSIPAWPDTMTMAGFTYYGCSGLTGTIPAWGANITIAQQCYQNCSGLTGTIPAWPDTMTDAGLTYYGCTGLTGAWTTVASELMPTNITSHSRCVEGTAASLRELFYKSWGGSLDDPTE